MNVLAAILVVLLMMVLAAFTAADIEARSCPSAHAADCR